MVGSKIKGFRRPELFSDFGGIPDQRFSAGLVKVVIKVKKFAAVQVLKGV
jgi:hypothetical protein